jgi:hypothetical protein
VRILSAFIGGHVETQNSLVYVHGGFPEWWTLTEIPSQAILGLVIVAEVERDEIDTQFDLFITINRLEGEGSDLGTLNLQFCRGESGSFVAGAPLYQNIAYNISVRFEEVGPYRISIKHEGEEVGDIRFGVRVQ